MCRVRWVRCVPSAFMTYTPWPARVPVWTIAILRPSGDQAGSPVTPMCWHRVGEFGVTSVPSGVTSRMPHVVR